MTAGETTKTTKITNVTSKERSFATQREERSSSIPAVAA